MAEADTQDKVTILVADDREYIRNLVRARLSTNPEYDVMEATDGQQALDMVHLHRPDILLTDWLMPKIDGLGLCRKIRELDLPNYVYLILLTAKEEKNDIVAGLDAGADDYIIKPFHKAELLARIATGTRIVKSQKALRQLNDLKNKFLGIAAHDMRNPLISIREFSDVLLSGDLGLLTEGQDHILKMIRSASVDMLALVNDLLDVSVIESGKLSLGIRRASLKNVLEKRISIAKVHSDAKKIKIYTNLENVPASYFDPNRIAQVIDNLVNNAIKFSPENSNIHITMVRDDLELKVFVRDEGPGIPKGEQDKLFGEFQRLSTVPTGGEKSTGLGLAIVKKIVEAHNGRVEVESQAGKGSSFIFSLPVQTGAQRRSQRSTAKAKVMIADSLDYSRNLFSTILSSMNTEVVASLTRSEDTVNTYRKQLPHLLLLDYDLENQQGRKTLGRILEEFPHAFVIMLLNSNADDEVGRTLISAGAANYIFKDTPISDIKNSIIRTWADFKASKESAYA